MSRDASPRTDDLLSRPRALHLLDSAGQAETLKSLAATRGITLQTSAPASPAPDNQRAICLQSVPATADAHWFSHVAPHHVPVRFHLPHAAELVITPAQDEARCTAAADALVQLGLQVLLAPARTGLLVDRIRHACLNEALALLGEGVPAEQVEKAGVDAGLVSGPLALLDAQGLGITDALYHQTLDGHGCCGHAHDHHHGHGHDHDHGHGHGHGHHHHDGHEHGCGCTGHSHDHLHHHTHEHHDHAPGSSCADQGQDDGHAHHGGCTAHDHGHAHHQHHAHEHGAAHGKHADHDHQAHEHHDHDCGCAGHTHDAHGHEHGHGHHGHGRHAEQHGHHHADQHGHEDHHGHHAHRHAHDHHDHTHDDHAASWPVMTDAAVYVMEKMAHGFQRKGGTPGQGFYSLDDDDDLELWSGLSSFVRRSLKLPADDARDRLRYITAVEVLQALASRAAGNAATIEMASAATGLWADAAHGPVAFIRSQGTDAFAARAAELAQAYGPRFALPDNWQKLLPA